MADVVIEFDAPSYYDLDDTDFEKGYINNADGYFGDCVYDADFGDEDIGNQKVPPASPSAAPEDNDNGDDDDAATVSSNNNHSSCHSSSRGAKSAVVPHSRKPLTKPASPRLQTARRAQATVVHRKVYVPPDTDAIEMAKQFHALPMPSSHGQPTIAPRVYDKPKKPATPRVTVPTTDRFGARVVPPSPSPEPRRATRTTTVRPKSARPHALSQDTTFEPRSARATSQSSPSKRPAEPRPKLEKSKSVGHVVLEPDLTVLRSEERARKRQELELRRRQLIAEREALKLAEEARRAEEALALERELRLQQSFKAKPIRKPKEPFRIAPSARSLTTPKSPKCLRSGSSKSG
ncbi:hypothetical protein ACHHYP_04362 [Achlya hypogyna]|uniref:TPX2 C-terminal domain-containing protein n=1 Tax=Achlya hypogyna TaxID=1202772 RepID=A0A1V9Z1B5_ACHHY|nr:hypothetical protein ACHHYP_04362 [Achlya hypogyna]